ncbi:MAG TPA: helix-turn-helix domain-containing protein [Solirubrobacteraceae bacterium]|jgi:transcriptional regulator with XRE-family HTH domain
MRMLDGEAYYTVSEVADAAGVSPQTIRTWEKRSPYRGRRSPGGHRLFDRASLDGMVRTAAAHRREAAVARAIPVEHADAATREHAAVGARIRAARLKAGWSQRALAETVKISRSLLSAIERGETPVTMTAFSGIADALGLPLSAFAAPSPWSQRLLPPEQRPRSVLGNGVTWEELAATAHAMAPAVMHGDPGASSGGALVLPNETFVYVLDGRFHVEVHHSDTAEQLDLLCGDAIFLQPGETISWTNPGTEVSRTLWVERTS